MHEAGVPTTVLRGNFFMNHLLKTSCDTIDNEGWFSNPLGKTRNSFVCTNDIAEVAAVCSEAAMAALEESVEAELVEMRHFEVALASVKPRITAELFDVYEQFQADNTSKKV